MGTFLSSRLITFEEASETFSYNPETGLFTRLKGKAHNAKIGIPTPGTKNNCGYYVFRFGDARNILAHRLAWLLTYGEHIPDGHDIDHINRDRADNRLANLRVATRVENARNTGKRRRNSSGHKGVCWCNHFEKWNAQIMVHGKHINLGYYLDKDAAIAARLEGERIHFGGG